MIMYLKLLVCLPVICQIQQETVVPLSSLFCCEHININQYLLNIVFE